MSNKVRAMAVALAAVVPLLAGCTATGLDALAPEDSSVESSHVLRLSEAPAGFSIDQPPTDSDHELIGSRDIASVSLIYRGDTLQPNIRGYFTSGDQAVSPEETIPAADGEEYVAVKFKERSYPSVMVDGTTSTQVQRLVITRDGEAQRIPLNDISERDFYLFQAPVDANPEDFVLEVEVEGVTQRLSLLTGERLPSELDALYGRHDAALNVSDSDGYVSEYLEIGDREHHVLTWVESVATAPLIHGHGWPGDGEMFFWADVQLEHTVNDRGEDGVDWNFTRLPPGSETTITVELEDGTVLEPVLTQEVTASYAPKYRVWFSVPADLDSAQLVVDLHPFPTGDDVRGALEQPRVELAFEFTESEEGV